jgi:hypothetical protein
MQADIERRILLKTLVFLPHPWTCVDGEVTWLGGHPLRHLIWARLCFLDFFGDLDDLLQQIMAFGCAIVFECLSTWNSHTA